jgi:hypothetical protein
LLSGSSSSSDDVSSNTSICLIFFLLLPWALLKVNFPQLLQMFFMVWSYWGFWMVHFCMIFSKTFWSQWLISGFHGYKSQAPSRTGANLSLFNIL